MIEFKEIPIFNGYGISKDGRIINLKTNRILKTYFDRDGYERLNIKRNTISVHRMMMITYKHIDNYNDMQVNHIDSNRQNNSLENLEWVTPHENVIHGMIYGNRTDKGSGNANSKLTEEDVYSIRKNYKRTMEYRLSVMKKHNLSKSMYYCIINNKHWKSVPSIEEINNEERRSTSIICES